MLLSQLTRLCEQWEHWGEALGLAEKDSELVPGVKKLDPAIRSQFVAALGKIRRLHVVLEGQAGQATRK